jgi:hypothetical protein
MSRGQVPYVDHAWRHLPGGTDPLPIRGGMDKGYEFGWGLWDEGGLDFLNLDGDGAPATNRCTEGASVALLQGQGEVVLPATPNPVWSPPGSFISGHCSYRVTDETAFAAVTEIRLLPTWSTSFGTGPYIDFNGTDFPPNQAAKAGHGTVWDFTNNVGYPFDLWTRGHSKFMCKLTADGTDISGTNPFTFQDGDGIQAFWTCFVASWD